MEAILGIEKWIHLRVQTQNSPSLARVSGLLNRPLLVYGISLPFLPSSLLTPSQGGYALTRV